MYHNGGGCFLVICICVAAVPRILSIFFARCVVFFSEHKLLYPFTDWGQISHDNTISVLLHSSLGGRPEAV